MGGVEHRVVVDGEEPSGVAPFFVPLGGELLDVGGVGGQAEGVYPGVALEAALVALLDHKGQGVPSGVLAAGARQRRGPRLVARFVVGVGQGAHMEANAGKARLVKVVEVGRKLGLGVIDCRGRRALRARIVGEVDVHAGYPGRAKLALGRCRQHCHCGKGKA